MAYTAPTHRTRPAQTQPGWLGAVAGWLKRRVIAHMDAPLRPW